jgi:hypothetical protein
MNKRCLYFYQICVARKRNFFFLTNTNLRKWHIGNIECQVDVGSLIIVVIESKKLEREFGENIIWELISEIFFAFNLIGYSKLI